MGTQRAPACLKHLCSVLRSLLRSAFDPIFFFLIWCEVRVCQWNNSHQETSSQSDSLWQLLHFYQGHCHVLIQRALHQDVFFLRLMASRHFVAERVTLPTGWFWLCYHGRFKIKEKFLVLLLHLWSFLKPTYFETRCICVCVFLFDRILTQSAT